MTTAWALSQSLERLRRLCGSSPDPHTLRSGVVAEMGSMCPFNAFVWPLSDPATATGMSPMAHIPCSEELPLLIKLKYLTPIGRWTSLIGATQPAATLMDATGGDLARSLLWNGLLRRFGISDVLSTVFADKHGCWGWLDLWRIGHEERFTKSEAEYVAAVAGLVTPALRDARARQFQVNARPHSSHQQRAGQGAGAGYAQGERQASVSLPQQAILTLNPDLAVVSMSASAQDWLNLLQRGPRPFQGVPAEVFNVAAQLLAREAGVDGHAASARVAIGSGLWAILRATRLDSPTPGVSPTLAVTIQECPPWARLDIFATSFGLTGSQRRLLELAASGVDTAALAAALTISPYTVQDQFKAIFAACGVRSRTALLAMALGTASGFSGKVRRR